MRAKPLDRFAAAQRVTLNALKRARRIAARTGVQLSEWEGEFLGSVEDRLKTFGRAFGDPEKGAAGEALSSLPAVRFGGHAVEARVYAEDAEDGFLPAVGRVAALRWPDGEGVRVEAGIEAGSDVSGRFDPMLAKVIAFGSSRGEALDR